MCHEHSFMLASSVLSETNGKACRQQETMGNNTTEPCPKLMRDLTCTKSGHVPSTSRSLIQHHTPDSHTVHKRDRDGALSFSGVSAPETRA